MQKISIIPKIFLHIQNKSSNFAPNFKQIVCCQLTYVKNSIYLSVFLSIPVWLGSKCDSACGLIIQAAHPFGEVSPALFLIPPANCKIVKLSNILTIAITNQN